MRHEQFKELGKLATKAFLYELVEELIDTATDLGVAQSNPLVDPHYIELNLTTAAEKLYNAIDALHALQEED